MEEQEEELQNQNELLLICRQIHNQVIGLETLSQYCDIDKFDVQQLNDILFQLGLIYNEINEKTNTDKLNLLQSKFNKVK
jgi:hypothetical protein